MVIQMTAPGRVTSLNNCSKLKVDFPKAVAMATDHRSTFGRRLTVARASPSMGGGMFLHCGTSEHPTWRYIKPALDLLFKPRFGFINELQIMAPYVTSKRHGFTPMSPEARMAFAALEYDDTTAMGTLCMVTYSDDEGCNSCNAALSSGDSWEVPGAMETLCILSYDDDDC